MSKKDISIIIPVYKGESFIVPSLKKIDSVLRRITRNYELKINGFAFDIEILVICEW